MKLDFLKVPPGPEMGGFYPSLNDVSSGHSSMDSSETVASFDSGPASAADSSDDAPLVKSRRV